MFATFFGGIATKIVMGLLVSGLIVGGIAYYNHIIRANALLAAQRDQLAAALKKQSDTIAERNAIWAQMLAMPDGRVRLCAVRGPSSGCCTEGGQCAP